MLPNTVCHFSRCDYKATLQVLKHWEHLLAVMCLIPLAKKRSSLPELSIGAIWEPIASSLCLSAWLLAILWSMVTTRWSDPVSSSALESPQLAIVSSAPYCSSPEASQSDDSCQTLCILPVLLSRVVPLPKVLMVHGSKLSREDVVAPKR